MLRRLAKIYFERFVLGKWNKTDNGVIEKVR